MARLRIAFLLAILPALLSLPSLLEAQSAKPAPASANQDPAPKTQDSPEIPRGKKLVLTDGTFQIVREYQRNADRVRYFSQERGAWEELPTALVDWPATDKANAEAEKNSAALADKIHKLEEGKRTDNVADIDASLLVAPGTFLPQSEGMFVVEGKTVRVLDQVGAEARTDKLRVLEQVLSPIPVVPGKKHVILPGAHAKLRLKSQTAEFYLREPPPDPDRVSSIAKSSRPGDDGPDVELLRVKVNRNERVLETIRLLLGQPLDSQVNSLSVQRWEVAPSVYRFTLGEPLPPGEYVLTEILPGGLNLFVWDFGVDAPPAITPGK